jgi:polynucleotide 5'-kinase involved in rRNA processing
MRAPRGAPPIAVVEGLLVGIHSEDGETLGIGRVRSVEVNGHIVVETPVAPARIARVVSGRAVWPAST